MFLAPKTPPRRPGPNYCVGRRWRHINHRRCTPGHGHSLTCWTDYCLKGEDRDYALIFSQEQLATSLRATRLCAITLDAAPIVDIPIPMLNFATLRFIHLAPLRHVWDSRMACCWVYSPVGQSCCLTNPLNPPTPVLPGQIPSV